ncbi:programmed cell death protein 2 [Mycotypha africana]|uniref:programmed cell death protein 2 n=1 Tax=Mycotypha africana TaxID=64632 RepID=UPI0023013F98|nr:programmed cell death protein 2 [Mycotypha africana]KAI8969940.1 programmed cell death protein 2 [Mycotypha africana]
MSKRADSNSDVSDLNPELSQSQISKEYTAQLGYVEDPESPLTADTFPSKSGGKPAWLNPEKFLTVKDVTCGNCSQPMSLLLQLYTPEDEPEEAFHRTVYVYCCRNGSCVKQDWKNSFKVYRSQLPRENPYYPATPNADDDDESIADEKVLESFTPKSFKPPIQCSICGLGGAKLCGQCGNAAYCCKEHQMVDWNLCQHKQFCQKPTLTETEQKTVNHLRSLRIFTEKEIVSEPEGKDKDEEEEEKQAEFFKANNPEEKSSDSKALVLAGDEAEEDTQAVDEAFLNFQLKIEANPDQVLRYERVEYDMPALEPLWVQAHQKPATIPNCDRCHGPRTFEFQILSTLLNYIGIDHVALDSLDWGSLYIFSCKQNCPVGDDVFAEEFIWKQDFSKEGMQLSANSNR